MKQFTSVAVLYFEGWLFLNMPARITRVLQFDTAETKKKSKQNELNTEKSQVFVRSSHNRGVALPHKTCINSPFSYYLTGGQNVFLSS